MDVLDGTTVFWLIALGMVAGAFVKVSLGKKGVDLIPNLIAGVLGSVVVGGITISLELPGGLLFAFLGSLSVLFLLNVFYLQPESSH